MIVGILIGAAVCFLNLLLLGAAYNAGRKDGIKAGVVAGATETLRALYGTAQEAPNPTSPEVN